MRKIKNAGYEKQVQLPYRVVSVAGSFVLQKNGKNVHALRAQSIDGADREAAIFLKNLIA